MAFGTTDLETEVEGTLPVKLTSYRNVTDWNAPNLYSAPNWVCPSGQARMEA